MRKALHELATGYAAATGCACEAEEGSCQAVLSVEGLGIHILFTDTQGFTLGVDESQELVTIQLAWDLSRLDAEGFARIVNNLLAVAADWMIRLDEWRPSAPGGENAAPADISGEVPFMNFLKV